MWVPVEAERDVNVRPVHRAMVALVTGLFITGAVVAITTTPVSMSPLVVGAGEVVNSDRLVVDSQQLTYTGTNVSGAHLVVNNTGGSNVSGNVTVTLKAANGSVVAQQTKTGVGFESNTTTTVTFSFSSPVLPESFFWFGTTVTRT